MLRVLIAVSLYPACLSHTSFFCTPNYTKRELCSNGGDREVPGEEGAQSRIELGVRESGFVECDALGAEMFQLRSLDARDGVECRDERLFVDLVGLNDGTWVDAGVHGQSKCFAEEERVEGEFAVWLAVMGEDEAAGFHGFEEFHAEPLFVAEDDDNVDGGAEGGEFGVGHGAVVDGGAWAVANGPEVARGL
jgi:hypothetical protein